MNAPMKQKDSENTKSHGRQKSKGGNEQKRGTQSQALEVSYSSGYLSFQAPGVIGSALALVDPVSVYCDWVRWKVGSAASIAVWHHVQLSEQIRP